MRLPSLPRSDALRVARGTLADAGGSSAAAAGSGGGGGGGGGSRRGMLGGGAAGSCVPFTFAAAGVRLTAAGISVLRDDVAPVRSFLAAA